MRNLFGWSSPPKRKDRKYSRLRAAALRDLISAKENYQIFVDIEEHGDGYVIPLSMMGLTDLGDGTINYGKAQTISDSTTGTTAATITVPTASTGTGEIWEFLLIHASFLVDATVADRTAELRVPSLGLTKVGTTPADYYLATDLTLSASQYGHIYVQADRYMCYSIDNGARAHTVDLIPGRMILGPGGKITASLTANGQAGDASSIAAIYRRIG